MKVIKRNGSEETFVKNKISEAVTKANMSVPISDRMTIEEIKQLTKEIDERCKQETHAISVDDIHLFVEEALMKVNVRVGTSYVTYRLTRELERKANTTDDKILSLLQDKNELIQQENANKNPTLVGTQRDYMAGEVSKDLAERYFIPQDIWKAHAKGIIHFHDSDYSPAMPIHNCDLWNAEDMLQNGTVISGVKIDRPKNILTAMNVAAQFAAQIASSQYGGQTITLAHLAPFVDDTRRYLKHKYIKECPDLTKDQLKVLVEAETKSYIKQGVQALNYELVTLQTTNGQAPFISICMYLNEAKNEKEKADLALLIEAVLEQRLEGVKDCRCANTSTAFPKLLYILEEDNMWMDTSKPEPKYWYLTQLAAKCSANRMVPDYISEKIMKGLKKDKDGKGHCYPSMGCRSFLTTYIQPEMKHQELWFSNNHPFHIEEDEYSLKTKEYEFEDPSMAKIISAEKLYEQLTLTEKVQKDGTIKTSKTLFIPSLGNIESIQKFSDDQYFVRYTIPRKPKYYGRFNQGVVTINLPYVGLEANGDLEKFWLLLDKRLELCHRALRLRHERLRGVKSDVAPILWQNGAIARLKPGETIDKLLYDGYSTISLGYVGLYECVKALTGLEHTSEEAMPLSKKIMQKLVDKCNEWKAVERIDYSVYGTPEESTTYKFAQALQKEFGKIEGITDKNYVTNSYHIPVFTEINAFDKLSLEAELQPLSPGGAISYVEVGDLRKNIPAGLEVIKHIYETIMYAEMNNTNQDHCSKCGYRGEIKLANVDGKLIWKCPSCGNTDLNFMEVWRRICGYLGGANNLNQGRLNEMDERYKHLK